MYDSTNIRPSAIYKLSDVAQGLELSLRTLQRIVAAGELIAVRAGRFTYVSGRSLLDWVEGRTGEKRARKRKNETEEMVQA